MKGSLIFSLEYMHSANGSTAIAKIMGDRGQPWRIPLPLQKVGETWGYPDKFPLRCPVKRLWMFVKVFILL